VRQEECEEKLSDMYFVHSRHTIDINEETAVQLTLERSAADWLGSQLLIAFGYTRQNCRITGVGLSW